jgi:hypothetical protein
MMVNETYRTMRYGSVAKAHLVPLPMIGLGDQEVKYRDQDDRSSTWLTVSASRAMLRLTAANKFNQGSSDCAVFKIETIPFGVDCVCIDESTIRVELGSTPFT